MQNDSETAAAGLAQGLHTIWEGKSRLREDGKASERGEFNLMLEFGVNHQGGGNLCGRFVDKRICSLVSKILVMQTGAARVIATEPTGMKRGLDLYHSALIASSIMIFLTLASLAK